MRKGKVVGGRYRVEEQLGVGSLGHVYAGKHTSLEQQVAIKVLLEEIVIANGGRRGLLARLKTAARIHHRNLVDVIDVGEVGDSVYIITERMPGPTLLDRLKQEERLRWSKARAVTLQIVGALKAAHKRKVLHRGLNTANCFVLDDPEDPDGEPLIKVSDLGLGHPGGGNTDLEQEHTSPIIANASFAAPELGSGKPPSVQSDIYAVGVILYQLLTGELPFDGATPFLVLAAHAERPVPPPRSKVPSIPPAVEAIVLRALAKDPRERFESTRELELALSDVPADAEIEEERDDDEAGPNAADAGPGASAPSGGASVARGSKPSAADRDEAMHAAFEAQQLEPGNPPPLAHLDARARAAYLGPAAQHLVQPPVRTTTPQRPFTPAAPYTPSAPFTPAPAAPYTPAAPVAPARPLAAPLAAPRPHAAPVEPRSFASPPPALSAEPPPSVSRPAIPPRSRTEPLEPARSIPYAPPPVDLSAEPPTALFEPSGPTHPLGKVEQPQALFEPSGSTHPLVSPVDRSRPPASSHPIDLSRPPASSPPVTPPIDPSRPPASSQPIELSRPPASGQPVAPVAPSRPLAPGGPVAAPAEPSRPLARLGATSMPSSTPSSTPGDLDDLEETLRQPRLALPRPGASPSATPEPEVTPPPEDTVVLAPAPGPDSATPPPEATVVLPDPTFGRLTDERALRTVVTPAPPVEPPVTGSTVPSRALEPRDVLRPPVNPTGAFVPTPPASARSSMPIIIIVVSIAIAATLIGLAFTCSTRGASVSLADPSGPSTLDVASLPRAVPEPPGSSPAPLPGALNHAHGQRRTRSQGPKPARGAPALRGASR